MLKEVFKCLICNTAEPVYEGEEERREARYLLCNKHIGISNFFDSQCIGCIYMVRYNCKLLDDFFNRLLNEKDYKELEKGNCSKRSGLFFSSIKNIEGGRELSKALKKYKFLTTEKR